MAIEVINSKADFDAKIKEGTYLVDFYATWCGPCQMLSPVLEEIASELEAENIKILKVDVDQAADIAGEYGVMSIPTLFMIKDGKNVSSQTGFKPGNVLVDWAKSV